MNPAAAMVGGAGKGMMANMPKLQGIMDKGLFGGGRMGQGRGIFGGQGGFGSGQGFLSRIGQGGEGFMGRFGTGEGAIGNMAPDFRTGQGRIAQMFNKGGAGNTGNMGYLGQRGPFGRMAGQQTPAYGGAPTTATAPQNPSIPSAFGGFRGLEQELLDRQADQGGQLKATVGDDEDDAYGFLGGNQGGWI